MQGQPRYFYPQANSQEVSVKIFLKSTILFALFGLMTCGGKSTDTLGPGDSGNPSATPGDTTSGNTQTSGSINREPQAGGNFLSDFPKDRILSGGVPPDGIPALTDPPFVELTSSEAAYLSDEDLILGVVLNGEAKAYPHNMGWWHEIINDVVGEHPIVVSFCPLTGTGLIFSGQGNDQSRIHCGVSGLLFNNNLIMYDRRQQGILYPQMIHIPVEGGTEELQLLPVIETTWRYWKQLYPDSKVISANTGIYSPSRYQSYPYGDYRDPNTAPLFPSFPSLEDNPTAKLFPPKTLTLGIRFGETAKAYPFPSLGTEAVINDIVADNAILVVYYHQEQYAIPFNRVVDGQTLTFEKTLPRDTVYPFLLRDKETGSTWNLKGEAIAGPLQNKTLEQLPSHNAFWFAWATFWQNTGIY